jgi:murein L,D-transpeptidase YafK
MSSADDSITSASTPVSKPSRFKRLWLLGFAAVAALIVIFANHYWPPPGRTFADQAMEFERNKRYAMWRLGMTLPGTPDLANLTGRLDDNGLALGAPVFVRIFKRDFEMELWMMRDGRFHRFATYPICRWSGWLGPKHKRGDRQSPEGFYTVSAKQMNPKSRWHRSFDIGFPNAFDSNHKRTGSFIMVHGGCGSVGCFAITNEAVDEVWNIVSAAFDRGQKRFQVQVLPFRMSDANLAREADSPHIGFWRTLKQGADAFDDGFIPPKISVCGTRYMVRSAGVVSDGSAPISVNCPDDKVLVKTKT